MQIFLSHDVDWPRSGPGKKHILARKDRFKNATLKKVIESDFNPYYGIPEVMDIEKELGIRSTFFFRPYYEDNSTVEEYSSDIQALSLGGWEVGVHLNDVSSVETVSKQKEAVDKILGYATIGTRVHYLKIDPEEIPQLERSGFCYDSSLTFSKERIDVRNSGFLRRGSFIIFPITVMDAYLFSYMHLTEETLVQTVSTGITNLRSKGAELITMLWHDNVLLMRGGRMYKQLLQTIHSLPEVEFLRGIDALKKVKSASPS